MSNDSRHEPNDELLSAYIDGELSGEQLRAVEALLAEDAAARAMVDELRNVSAAVGSLPPQSVPPAWRERLNTRLDQAAAARDAAGEAMSSLPVARSPRGWWWSAAAIAAAVAILLFLPKERGNQVAQGPVDHPAAEQRADQRPATDEPEADDDHREAVPEMRALDSSADRPSEPPATAAKVASDPPSALGRNAVEGGMPEMLSGEAMTRSNLYFDAADDAEANDGYMIVWADVPRQVVKDRQIDRLLLANGIAVDPQPGDWQAAAEPVRQQIALRNSARSGQAQPAQAGPTHTAEARQDTLRIRADNQSTEDQTTDEQTPARPPSGGETQRGEPEVEGAAILVEATASQIADCLADMQNDPRNYFNLTVEPVWQAATTLRQGGRAGDRQPTATESRANEPAREMSLGAPVAPVESTDGAAQPAARAQRLEQPADEYLPAFPPPSTGTTVPLRLYGSATADGQPAPPPGEQDEQVRRAQLRRWVVDQTQAAKATDQPAPADETDNQPMQVLFVFRCADASNQQPAAPAAEPPPEP